jgi:hypothetical protein
MSFTPTSLAALRSLWTSAGGSFLGVVGSMTTHCGGYHLGRDRLFGTCACKPDGVCEPGRGADDYSVKTARDKAGLSNAGMAIDLGPLAGQPGSEVTLAKWLIGQCQSGAPDTRDIRAINYKTLRWDRQNGQTSAVFVHAVNETGHVHIEWYRDSESRDKTAAVKRWLATRSGELKVICSGGRLWSAPSKDSTPLRDLVAGDVCKVTTTVAGGAWSFGCAGTTRNGTAWHWVSAINGVTIAGYAATGRF